jgi:murein DD-endopeptidase MepM/ murein hydrolase activator NlpD
MHPLLLALHLFVATPDAVVSTSTPTHYISYVGYEDGQTITPPNGQLTWPTNVTKLTRGFEVGGHTGMDIDARTGDPVYAAFAGTVVTVSHTGPYGNKIIIRHANRADQISTLYAHLTDTVVTEGQTVSAGEIIGTVGATGNADGDHLHFEVLVNDVAVDPQLYF